MVKSRNMPFIPFGKFKGFLVSSVVKADPNYLHWLLNEEWFQEKKWSALYQIIETELEKSELLEDLNFEP